MAITLTAAPDFAGLAFIMRREIARALINAARFVVDDNIERIKQRIAYDDAPQKPNSAKYAARKRRTHGHDIPLLRDGVLSDASGYRGNGEFLTSLTPEAVMAAGMQVTVTVTRAGDPPRDEVVAWLSHKGYRFMGESEAARERLRVEMVEAVARAKQAYAQQRLNASRRGR